MKKQERGNKLNDPLVAEHYRCYSAFSLSLRQGAPSIQAQKFFNLNSLASLRKMNSETFHFLFPSKPLTPVRSLGIERRRGRGFEASWTISRRLTVEQVRATPCRKFATARSNPELRRECVAETKFVWVRARPRALSQRDAVRKVSSLTSF